MFPWWAEGKAGREGLQAVFPSPGCLLHPPEHRRCSRSFQDYEAPRQSFSCYAAPFTRVQGDDRRRREERERGGNRDCHSSGMVAGIPQMYSDHIFLQSTPDYLANYSGRDFQGSAAPFSSPTDVPLVCAKASLSLGL